MTHPAKPDNHAHLRSILRRLQADSFSGWHGNDQPVVRGEGMDVDEMLEELRRRAEDRLEEYEENQSFTPPSKKRRDARQKAEHRISNDLTETW